MPILQPKVWQWITILLTVIAMTAAAIAMIFEFRIKTVMEQEHKFLQFQIDECTKDVDNLVIPPTWFENMVIENRNEIREHKRNHP